MIKTIGFNERTRSRGRALAARSGVPLLPQ
jgi:hypothetical protein